MDFRDTLSTLMPQPRDDEPASLRQDILDELEDHLACAYNRELLRGADSSLARERVFERFGDPATVARRLWFDAMKGKIMAQRVLIGTCLVVTLASASLVGLVWNQSGRATAQTAEANRKLSEALAQAQLTNRDMLSRLSEMSEAIRHPHSPDWNPVKFIVTVDTPDGPPAAGCWTSLSLRDGDRKQIVRTSDASGIVDFGLVHPGNYSFRISRNSDREDLWGWGELTVEPGSRIEKRIVYPNKALEPVPLHVQCEWPVDLEKAGLVVDAQFQFVPFEKDDTSWSFNSGAGTATHSVLFGPGAALRDILSPWALYLWATSSPPTIRADILMRDVRTINEPAEPLKWERGSYRLSELIVLRRFESLTPAAGRLQFDVLVRCYPEQAAERSYVFRQAAPTEKELRTRGGMMGGNAQIAIGGLALTKESWSKVATSFNALPDRVNEWKITLPEELIKAVREELNGDQPTHAEPGGPAAPAEGKP